MITREQAKEKADSVGKVPDFVKKQLDDRISTAAENGDYQVFLYIPDLWQSVNVYQNPVEPTALQKNVIKFLTEAPNNFTISFTQDGDSYIPRGLADDIGDGPSYVTWGILVKFD
jgi:hypothetical protein